MKKQTKLGSYILSLFAFCTVLSSCNYNNSKAQDPAGRFDSNEKPGLEFESVQRAIFVPKCVECHRQYQNYQGVIRELPAIQRTIEANRMPKNDGPLSESLRNLLNAWISAGAPERRGAAPVTIPATELQATWNSISAQIIFPKCLVCHNPTGEAKFLDLSDRDVIFQNRNRVFSSGAKLIDFDSADKSYLIEILKDEEEPMPPTYSKIERVDTKSIGVVEEWIRRGLP